MKIQTFSILAGTATCNASCPYCISKMTGKKQIGYKLHPTNWTNFHKACRLAQVNSVSTVLITGKGEPTLYPEQLTKYLENLKKFDFPLIELQTNGLLLEKNNLNKYLKKWYSLGLNTIAISISHYKKEKNKEIYTPNKDYINLEKVIEKLHKLGFSVRLSSVLMKGFIDSPKEVRKLAEFARENCVEQLTIRKLGLSVASSEFKEVYDWSKKHLLDDLEIKEISDFLENSSKKLMTLPHGAVIFELNKQNICLTDCEMVKPKTEDIRTLIFFPDGHLRWNWEFGGAILL